MKALSKKIEKKIAKYVKRKKVKPLIKMMTFAESTKYAIAECKGYEKLWPYLRPQERESHLRYLATDIREKAAQALGVIGKDEAATTLINALGDSDLVRLAAAQSLDQLGHPMWKDMIKGNNNDFKRMGESGNEKVVPVLYHALENVNSEVRSVIKDALNTLAKETGSKLAAQGAILAEHMDANDLLTRLNNLGR